MPIRALIVDDEKLAREEMKFLLEQIGDIEIVGEAGGGEEAVSMVSSLSPDILFLDIQMPVLDGFGVVRKLMDSNIVPLVVFTTAYDQYAIKAFEINAVDYLLKPVERERLKEAIERARSIMPLREEFIEKLRKLTDSINVARKFLPKLVVKKGEEMDLVETEKIAMLERRGHDVIAHTSEGDMITNYDDLELLEVQLDPAIFMRLGTDHIVNIRMIAEIVPWAGGSYVLTLDDSASTEMRLTRTQAQMLKNKAGGK